MSDLVVRAYNVGFGDAILVSIPDRATSGVETVRHILFDVGNLLAGKANKDEVFEVVVADIIAKTGGEVDLYVMTHEHLDHTQGLLTASNKGLDLRAKHSWLTGSAKPDYYENHPQAKKRRLEMDAALDDAARTLQASPDDELEELLWNNSSRMDTGALGLKTADYIAHLRTIAPPDQTHYIDRTMMLEGRHPFEEAKLTVLAPEEDTSDYYGRLPAVRTLTAAPESAMGLKAPKPERALPNPPPGVDPGAYFDLVRSRRGGIKANLLEIDAANNNTSVVVQIEWRGWRLLFSGDAELRSWRTMNGFGLLQPVDVIKVSHHGSHNGTLEEIFDTLLPPIGPDARERYALVSTADGSFDSVPELDTLKYYADRCELVDTRDVGRGEAQEIVLTG
jgi:beta-lactamase superfamily II metal-dependent hydrolase